MDETKLCLTGEHLVAAISSTDDGTISARVAEMECSFLIDSGAQVNTLTETSFRVLSSIQEYSEGIFNLQDRPDMPLRAYASSGIFCLLKRGCMINRNPFNRSNRSCCHV